ncbi:MAG: YrzI family small protein [Clostridiales bacterium]|nr:YrzI family small protein [Clostridiales bacterium]
METRTDRIIVITTMTFNIFFISITIPKRMLSNNISRFSV